MSPSKPSHSGAPAQPGGVPASGPPSPPESPELPPWDPLEPPPDDELAEEPLPPELLDELEEPEPELEEAEEPEEPEEPEELLPSGMAPSAGPPSSASGGVFFPVEAHAATEADTSRSAIRMRYIGAGFEQLVAAGAYRSRGSCETTTGECRDS
jgi:hypothetical protein